MIPDFGRVVSAEKLATKFKALLPLPASCE